MSTTSFTPFACAGVGACTAELFTAPADRAKVLMQLRGTSAGKGVPSGSMLNVMRVTAMKDGVAALFRGLSAGFQRQLVFASIRIGCYEPIRNTLSGGSSAEDAGIVVKMAAGMLSGGLAITIANPTELVKIRMQADQTGRYSSTAGTYQKIWLKDGLAGFWRGIVPNLVRNSAMCCVELSTYDTAKQMLKPHLGDTTACHMTSALICGAAATLCCSPIDVIKTRYMNATAGKYATVVDCFRATAKEGPKAFYRGASVNFVRLAGWNMIMFMTFEKLKLLASGLDFD